MNKFIGSLIAVAVLSGAAFAAETTNGVTFGVNQSRIVDNHGNKGSYDGTGFNLGLEKVKVYDNNFVFGFGSNLGYTSMDLGANGKTSIYSFDTVVKLGYQAIHNLTAYGIGGVELQYVDYNKDPISQGGFVYGGGAEYKILDYLAVNVEYKATNQKSFSTSNTRDLNYNSSTTGVNLKYIF
jgi:opacity protein-like surface antigen